MRSVAVVDDDVVVCEGSSTMRVSLVGATLVSLVFQGEETTCMLDRKVIPCAFGTYAGATCGRVANRICKGKFQVDGIEYQLAVNNNGNALHGGPTGLHAQRWKVDSLVRSQDEIGVALSYTSPDGHEGYPGNLECKTTYTLATNTGSNKAELRILYQARVSGKACPVNIVNHAYWNLDQKSGTIRQHRLQLFCPTYLPYDKTCIPYGRFQDVTGTDFSFLNSALLNDRINKINGDYFPQNCGIDHCFTVLPPDDNPTVSIKRETIHRVLSGTAIDLGEIACLSCKSKKMSVFTTLPGVQVYTANWMPGKHQHSCIALETQYPPDGVNQHARNPKFHSTILRPGEQFQHATIHVFSSS